jgi:hypothetical protein
MTANASAAGGATRRVVIQDHGHLHACPHVRTAESPDFNLALHAFDLSQIAGPLGSEPVSIDAALDRVLAAVVAPDRTPSGPATGEELRPGMVLTSARLAAAARQATPPSRCIAGRGS